MLRWALLVAGTALLAWYVGKLDTGAVKASLARFPAILAGEVLLLNLVPGLVKFARWRRLLHMEGIVTGRFMDYLRINAAFFLGLVTPGTAGELTRALTVEGDRARAMAIVSFEKFTDLFVLCLLAMASVSYVLLPHQRFVGTVAATLVAAVGVYAVFLRANARLVGAAKRVLYALAPERLDRSLRFGLGGLNRFLRRPNVLLMSVACSTVLWLTPMVQMLLIYRGLGVALPVRIVAFTFFLPYLLGVVSMVPLGLGTFDLAARQAATSYLREAANVLALAPLAYRLFVTLPLVVVGYLSQIVMTALQARREVAS